MMMRKKLPENVADELDRKGCDKRKKEISQEKLQRNQKLMPKTGKRLMLFTVKSAVIFVRNREVS